MSYRPLEGAAGMLPQPDPLTRRGHKATILLCFLAALCEGIDLQVAGVAAPGIAAEMHPPADLLGYFFSASTLGLLIGALLGGPMADRVGRKRVLVGSVAVFGFFSLATTAAQDAGMLLWMRLATGIGLGGAYPNMLALASEASAGQRRQANTTLVYAGTPLGGALVSLGSSLLPPEHWRWLFALGGILPLVLTPVMALYLRESPAYEHARATGQGVQPSMRLAQFAALLREGRARITLLLWSCFVLLLIIQYLLLSWLPTMMIGNGLTKPQAGMAQLGFNIGGAIAAVATGLLLEGRWRRVAVYTAFILLPLLMLAMASAPAEVLVMSVLATAIGCAAMSALAFLYATAPLCYPTVIRGTGMGAAVGAGRVGSIIGPLIGGLLVGMGHTPSRLLLDLLPIAIVAAVGAMLLVATRPRTVAATPP